MAADDGRLLDALVAIVGPPSGDSSPVPRTLALVGPGPDPSGGPARIHYALWEGSQEVVRCRTPQRLIRAAVAWLDSWSGARPGHLVGVRCLAAVDRNDRAVLLPPHLRSLLHPLEARLRRLGLQPVDSPVVDLDPLDGALVVGRSIVAPGGELPPAVEAVPSGRFLVDHVVVPVAQAGISRPVDALAHLARSAVAGPQGRTVLECLKMVTMRSSLQYLGSGTTDEVLSHLRRNLVR